LLKLVSGLYDVTEGEILIMGEGNSASRRKNVAMVMQNTALFPASIRDNITCGHEMDEADILHACNAAQLSGWIDTLPNGLHTFVGERGGKVSGGQAQRIAIARAMAKNTQVILLDEPMSALDNDTSANLIASLTELVKGKTVLHVSHKPETLVGCDRILRLAEGKLHVL
jgi:ATP-binding cassette subfamily B protein/subfamily B ATP-binding cassette protein MsbA